LQGIVEHPVAGFYLSRAKDVTLRNCKVKWGNNRPEYYGPAVEADRVQDLKIEDCKGEAAHPEREDAVKITNLDDRPTD
jgi:hypothetical protein